MKNKTRIIFALSCSILSLSTAFAMESDSDSDLDPGQRAPKPIIDRKPPTLKRKRSTAGGTSLADLRNAPQRTLTIEDVFGSQDSSDSEDESPKRGAINFLSPLGHVIMHRRVLVDFLVGTEALPTLAPGQGRSSGRYFRMGHLPNNPTSRNLFGQAGTINPVNVYLNARTGETIIQESAAASLTPQNAADLDVLDTLFDSNGTPTLSLESSTTADDSSDFEGTLGNLPALPPTPAPTPNPDDKIWNDLLESTNQATPLRLPQLGDCLLSPDVPRTAIVDAANAGVLSPDRENAQYKLRARPRKKQK